MPSKTGTRHQILTSFETTPEAWIPMDLVSLEMLTLTLLAAYVEDAEATSAVISFRQTNFLSAHPVLKFPLKQ